MVPWPQESFSLIDAGSAVPFHLQPAKGNASTIFMYEWNYQITESIFVYGCDRVCFMYGPSKSQSLPLCMDATKSVFLCGNHKVCFMYRPSRSHSPRQIQVNLLCCHPGLQVPPPSLAPLTQQQFSTAAALLQSLPVGAHNPDEARKQDEALGGKAEEVACPEAMIVEGASLSAECVVVESRSPDGTGAKQGVDTRLTADEAHAPFSPLELSCGCSYALLDLVRASIKPPPVVPSAHAAPAFAPPLAPPPGAGKQSAAATAAAAAAAAATGVGTGAETIAQRGAPALQAGGAEQRAAKIAAQGGTSAVQAGGAAVHAHRLSVYTSPQVPPGDPIRAPSVGSGGPASWSGAGTVPLHQAGAGAGAAPGAGYVAGPGAAPGGRVPLYQTGAGPGGCASREVLGQGWGQGGKGAVGGGKGRKQQHARGRQVTHSGKPQLHLR
ncbi:hypothetical protein DUNSADRAFT_15571 [Dunaliella salina]|uniref:Encoded protein n=1 Tax=Dunaliella salina TaxID=3046 RepID=A0ABQ7G542_DUNSA|nr:hypothetical protein DUNSADRAFT_15571 [Dunaliella salina]|eukprot:KAF5829724.1 hypothetical protein DUNSADRAFT_15571 [Dunaliella salina]